MQTVEHRLLVRWQVGYHAMQKECGLVQQALRGLYILHDDTAGEHMQLCVLFRRKVLSGKDDDRQFPAEGQLFS